MINSFGLYAALGINTPFAASKKLFMDLRADVELITKPLTVRRVASAVPVSPGE